MYQLINLFGKAVRVKKVANQLDLFNPQLDMFDQKAQEGAQKKFGEGDERKLQTTAGGKKRWVNADEEVKSPEKRPSSWTKPEDVKASHTPEQLSQMFQQKDNTYAKEMADYASKLSKAELEENIAYLKESRQPEDKGTLEIFENEAKKRGKEEEIKEFTAKSGTTIKTGETYYDSRYNDSFTVEKLEKEYPNDPPMAILKYSKVHSGLKGDTDRTSANYVIYNIDGGAYSLKGEEAKPQSETDAPSDRWSS